MPDPEIQTPREFQFYVQQHGLKAIPREFERGSLPGLQKSISKAHDNFQRQVGINTRVYVQLTRAEQRIGWQSIWIQLLAAGNVAQWAIILILGKMLLVKFLGH